MRIALSLGLHRNVRTKSQDWVEMERRQRLWWTIYQLDQEVSMQLGHPCAIVDEALHIQTPFASEKVSYPNNPFILPLTILTFFNNSFPLVARSRQEHSIGVSSGLCVSDKTEEEDQSDPLCCSIANNAEGAVPRSHQRRSRSARMVSENTAPFATQLANLSISSPSHLYPPSAVLERNNTRYSTVFASCNDPSIGIVA